MGLLPSSGESSPCIDCISSSSHCWVLFVKRSVLCIEADPDDSQSSTAKSLPTAAVYVTAKDLAAITAELQERCQRYGRKRSTSHDMSDIVCVGAIRAKEFKLEYEI